MSTLKAGNIQPQSDSDPLVLSTNAAERMRIDTSGNVGIGTAPTSYKLTVGGSSPQFSVIDSGANLSRALITVTPNGVSFGNTYISTAIPLGFNIGITEVARFDTSGNFGIGTTSPVVALDVVGQARCSSGTTYSHSSSTLTTKSYVDDMQRIGATRHLAVFTNTLSAISSIVGYNTTAAFTITSAGGSLNVLIPSGFGTWHILVAIYNTSSGALNALTVATVASGVNTSIASLTNTSPSGQSIMLSCTRHS